METALEKAQGNVRTYRLNQEYYRERAEKAEAEVKRLEAEAKKAELTKGAPPDAVIDVGYANGIEANPRVRDTATIPSMAACQPELAAMRRVMAAHIANWARKDLLARGVRVHAYDMNIGMAAIPGSPATHSKANATLILDSNIP